MSDGISARLPKRLQARADLDAVLAGSYSGDLADLGRGEILAWTAR